MTQLRYIIVLAFLIGMPLVGNAQTAVIVNKTVPQETMSEKDILDIYTLNWPRWDNGTRVTVFDLKREGKTKKAFYRHIEMDEDELRRIWLRKQFSGKAMPPKIVDTEEDVVDRVANTPGAIGYVSLNAARKNKDVKVVARIR